MFDINSYNDLVKVSNSTNPCVSIYIPTSVAGKTQEDRIRFKNALSDAVDQLTDVDLFPQSTMTKQDARKYLSAGHELLDNEDFWTQLSKGLVVFIAEDRFEYYTMPIDFKPFVYVGNQFYLRSVLPAFLNTDKFFVLALSQNSVRFFEAHKNTITPVKIKDLIPNGMKEMIGVDDREQTLQAHSGRNDNKILHGHGNGKDDKQEQLKKYFKDVDDGLMKMLFDETAPLIIYSVDYQIPIYKEISKYSNISEFSIEGNPENDDPVLIHERAVVGMENYFKQRMSAVKEEFNQALSEDKASFSVSQIIPAAMNGKVQSLFVDKDTEEVWGKFNQKANTVSIHPERQADSACLLNAAALATFNSKGEVYNISRIEFPRIVAQVNAIYRY